MDHDFVSVLASEFNAHKNESKAKQQKAYMRDKFDYFGLPAEVRREISKPFLLKKYLTGKTEACKIIRALWNLPEREFQYVGMELLSKYLKQLDTDDIQFIIELITTKSWWDTVDFLAYNILGKYFMILPDQRDRYVNKWLHSNNIWLQRSALLKIS